jgi:hypothetical protein
MNCIEMGKLSYRNMRFEPIERYRSGTRVVELSPHLYLAISLVGYYQKHTELAKRKKQLHFALLNECLKERLGISALYAARRLDRKSPYNFGHMQARGHKLTSIP